MSIRKAVAYMWDLKAKKITKLDELFYKSDYRKIHEKHLNKPRTMARTLLEAWKKYFRYN